MKKYALLLIIALCFSCEDDDSQCLAIEEQYLKTLGYTGGSQAAIDEVTKQYLEKKREYGCD